VTDRRIARIKERLDAQTAGVRLAVTPILADTATVSDAKAAQLVALFDGFDPDGRKYLVGDVVTVNGVAYRCVQAHTSQQGWAPDKTPALWTAVRKVTGGQPDQWRQPTGSSDAYKKGDRVTFQGAVYESVIDANTWSPAAYPAGWKKL